MVTVTFAAIVALWPTAVESFVYDAREFVLDVMHNDLVWAKHLDVVIKIEPKMLSTAAQNVLIGLKALDRAQDPQQSTPVMVRALNIVADVASNFSGHGLALEFALSAIASAIKCNALSHVLMQLHAIEQTIALQNENIKAQSGQVWKTLVHILDKLALLKESIDVEFEMFQQWTTVVNQNMSNTLPKDFHDFKALVVKTLNASCALCEFDEIQEKMNFNGETENWNTHDGAMQIFSKSQKLLSEMFDDIPITTMQLEIWESFLNKPKTIESLPELNPV